MKIYFCTPTGRRGASSRYRVFQFLPYLNIQLEKETFQFLDDTTYSLFKSNNLFSVFYRLIFLLFKPLSLIFKVKRGDILLVHRDIYPFGLFWLERLLKRKGAKIIFDLDDAIFLDDTSEISNKKNKLLYNLKYGKRYDRIIKISDMIICGNEFLESYCKQINSNTIIIPTVIDLNCVKNIDRDSSLKDKIVFGWIGNPGNSSYFKKILPIFDKVADKYKKQIVFRCIGGNLNYIPNSPYFAVEELAWSEETEYENLSQIDVGIMPLEDSDWSKGKCGLKILQYMSVGKTTIADAVGVNTSIIDHGKNGFLTHSLDDWEKYIELVVKEHETNMLEEMGMLAEEKLQAEYSLQVHVSRLKEVIDKVASS
ncbi:glycosyltransferase [Bacillus sp. 22475]|uniref:glycosyltransferase n=1 Tax=Bacillus sp. 22475 TaxID=3453925 RepID=UPI003F856EC8